MEKYSKGQVEAISGIIIGAVLLFVGLYMVASVSNALPAGTVSEYTYSTATNGTDVILNASNQTIIAYAGTIPSISGVLPVDESVTVTFSSLSLTNRTAYVYLNDVLASTVTVVASANGYTPTITTAVIDGIYVGSNGNNITYVLG
jgi:hypothetical protein